MSRNTWMLPALLAAGAMLVSAASPPTTPNVTSVTGCPNGPFTSPQIPGGITAGSPDSSFPLCIYGNFTATNVIDVNWNDITTQTLTDFGVSNIEITDTYILVNVPDTLFNTVASSSGPDNIVVTVTETDLGQPPHDFTSSGTFLVNPPLTAFATTYYGTVGTPDTLTLYTFGTGPYGNSYQTSGVPPGFPTFPTSAPFWTGTPTTAGPPYPFTYSVTDAWGNELTVSASLRVFPALTISPTSPLPSGQVGVSYSVNFTASGGGGGYTFAIVGSNPPPGLTLSSGGVFSGVPTAFGTFTFNVQVTDGFDDTYQNEYSVVISASPLFITNTSPLPPGQVGVTYGDVFTATGGTGGYTFAVYQSAAPPGLTLSSAGLLTGTPTTYGSFGFTVRVTDSASDTATHAYTLVIAPPALLITNGSPLPSGQVGVAYSDLFTATGGTGGYTFSLYQSAAPPGLTLSPTGVLSGTPTTYGSFGFTVQVTDSSSNVSTHAYTLVIAAPTLSITTFSPLPGGQVGVAYTDTFTASGGTGGYTFSLYQSTLPAGLTLTSGGVLSGTPTASGTYGFTVQVTDSSSNTASRAFSLTIAAPTLTITTVTLPAGQMGVAYTATITATGGSGGYTFSLFQSTLPAGLTLSSGGVLSGTPTVSGTFGFNVQVSDSSENSASRTFSLVIAPPTLQITTAASLPGGQVGTAYSTTITATGGSGGYTFSLYQSTLPGGLTLSSGGVLSGTPTASGTFGFNVQVADSSSNTASRTFSLVIAAAPIQITTASLPGGQVSTAYNATVTATGGTGGYIFSLVQTTQPPGLTLSAAGVMSGTPTAAGSFGFSIRVTDSSSNTTTKAFTIVITAGTSSGPLALTTPPLNSVTIGTAVSIQFTATGGTPPYTFSVTGTIPPGTHFAANGTLTGTPTALGTYPFTVTVNDSYAGTVSQAFSLAVVNPPLAFTTPPALPSGTSGSQYATTIGATGGTGAYAFTVARGSLPPGLTLNILGTISGTPSTFGTYLFTLQVADAAGDTVLRDFTLIIAPVKLTLTTGPLANVNPGVALNIQFAASGGIPPYTFAEYGALPPGTQFSTSGALTGTPTTAGTYQFIVFVNDSASSSASQTYTLNVVQPPLTITTASPLTAGQKGTAYSATFAATGGLPPYTWTATGIPAGLTLASATGVLSGNPTQDGVFQIAVTVTDSTVVAVNSATKTFSLTIGAVPITFTNNPLPNGTVAAAYTAQVSTTGGDAPVTFSSTGLPPGLALSPTGSVTGTPTTAGSFTAVITATDVNSLSAKATYTVVIAPQLVITTTSAGSATLGASFSATLAATGGTPPYTWSGSNLPAGLTLSSSGVISGTPAAAAGAASFSATVTDSNKVSTTKTISLTIALPTASAATITGVGSTVPPATQPSLTVTLSAAYPANITVNLTMTVVTDSGLTDPAFQFSTGGLTAQTNIPAGSTVTPTAIPVQLGTDAATVTITAQLVAGGQDVTPAPAPKVSFRLNAAAPVITSITATRTSSGFTVTIVGFATSRDVTTANFTFTPASSSNLGTTQLTVPVSAIFAPWYSSSASAPFGSQFTFTQPFTVTGSNTAIVSVSVTLTNSVGTSSASSSTLQ